MAATMTENSIAVGRIRAFARRGALPHALILSGSGDRLEAARYAAAAMLCSAEDKPCLQCNQCRKVLAGIHPDVLLVEESSIKPAVRHLLAEEGILAEPGAAVGMAAISEGQVPAAGSLLVVSGRNTALDVLL